MKTLLFTLMLFWAQFALGQTDLQKDELVNKLSGKVWRSETTPWKLESQKKYYTIELTKKAKLFFYDDANKKLEFNLQRELSNDSIFLFKQRDGSDAGGFLVLKLTDSLLNVSFLSKDIDCCKEKSWAYFDQVASLQNIFRFTNRSCCTNHNPKHCAESLEEMAKFTSEKNCIF